METMINLTIVRYPGSLEHFIIYLLCARLSSLHFWKQLILTTTLWDSSSISNPILWKVTLRNREAKQHARGSRANKPHSQDRNPGNSDPEPCFNPVIFHVINVGLMTISMHVFLGSLGPIPKSTCDSSNMRTDPSTNPLAPGRQGKFSELSNVKGGKWHLIVFSILYLFNDWHGWLSLHVSYKAWLT